MKVRWVIKSERDISQTFLWCSVMHHQSAWCCLWEGLTSTHLKQLLLHYNNNVLKVLKTTLCKNEVQPCLQELFLSFQVRNLFVSSLLQTRFASKGTVRSGNYVLFVCVSLERQTDFYSDSFGLSWYSSCYFKIHSLLQRLSTCADLSCCPET